MSSDFIVRYSTPTGARRYRVRYRLGGRESTALHGGSFRTEREARARRAWIAGELAALRVPALDLHSTAVESPVTLRDIAERWRASRIDVADRTATNHRVVQARILPVLGGRVPASITPSDIAG